MTVSNEAETSVKTSNTVMTEIGACSGLTLYRLRGRGGMCPIGGTDLHAEQRAGRRGHYPAIMVTVKVRANATSPQVNAVSVSGGGSATANTTDSTTSLPVRRY